MARLRKSVRRSRKPKMVLECKIKSESSTNKMKKSMKSRISKSKKRRSKKRKSRSRRRKSKKDGCGDGCGDWDTKKDGAPRRRP